MASEYVGETAIGQDSECVVCGSLVPDRIGMFQKAKGTSGKVVTVVFHKACYIKEAGPKIEATLRERLAKAEQSSE